MADQWKSQMSNVAVVVDLGPIERLMTIKGNWDAKKGAEAQYGGKPDRSRFPRRRRSSSRSELEPVIEILQILQDLQSENYKDAFQQRAEAGDEQQSRELGIQTGGGEGDSGREVSDAACWITTRTRLSSWRRACGSAHISTPRSPGLERPEGFAAERRRLSWLLWPALGHVRLAFHRDGLCRRPGDARHRGRLESRSNTADEIRLWRADRGRPAGSWKRQRALHGRRRNLHRLDAAQHLGVSCFTKGTPSWSAGLVSVTITIEAKGTIKRATDAALPGGDRTDLEAQVTFGLDISIFLVIDISFSKSWSEQRQIA